MVWHQWVYAGFMALSALGNVCMIGRPRTTATPGSTVIVLVLTGLLVWLVLSI